MLVALDKQGRVNVDEKLRDYAELHPREPGRGRRQPDRLEIWSPERYARIDAEGTDDIAGDPA